MRHQPWQVPSRTSATLIACAWMALCAIHIPSPSDAADKASRIGVPQPDAEKNARDLKIAETRAPKERQAKFSLFECTLPANAEGIRAFPSSTSQKLTQVSS